MTAKKRSFEFEIADFGLDRQAPRTGAPGLEEGQPGCDASASPYGALAGRLEMVRRRKQGCLAQAPPPRGRRS